MEARANIPSHGQSLKDFLPDVIRGWLVLQRSGLSESSKKTVLGKYGEHAGSIEDRRSSQTTVARSRASGKRWRSQRDRIERCARTSKERQMSGSRMCIRMKQRQKVPRTRTSRETHGNRPRGTKLVHGKLMTISSKEASQMKLNGIRKSSKASPKLFVPAIYNTLPSRYKPFG